MAHGETGRLWRAYAAALVKLRWFVVLFWVVASASTFWLPTASAGNGDLEGFGQGNPAIEAELRSFELFGFPLLSRVMLVQHDPEGLSAFAQAEAVLRAVGLSQGAYDDTPILGALPVPNTFGAFPGAQQDGTTVLTYLFQNPFSGFDSQKRAAEEFAEQHLQDADDAYVGVTGSVPARAAQAGLIEGSLHRLELLTISAILLIVGVTFRSVVAPVITLLAAGTAVVVTLGVGGAVAALVGVPVPADLRPVIVALLLGVVTDYCIFFLSGLRHRIAAGSERLPGARAATSDFAPIVAVAGVTVATGTATLVVAESALFRGFGPGITITVLVGLLVAITLVPALMGIVGQWAFWPSRPASAAVTTSAAGTAGARAPGRITALVTTPRHAAVVVAACVLALGLAAVPLAQLNLGLGFVTSLPDDEPVARAAAAAEAGFAPGILAPTEVLLEGDDLADNHAALRRVGEAIERQPGVAGVLGPGDNPVVGEFGVLVAESGDAARYLLVFDSAALGPTAIQQLSTLRDRLPSLLDEAGVGDDVEVSIAGDTALAQGIVEETTDDLLRISTAALVANLLMLVLFLRALVAPLYLLAANVLALCATLGLTVAVFQGLLGQDGLTFYVPFAAAVLLVSLGSDYNIFAVGHIWQLASRRPLRQAMVLAIPQSTRAITSAGIALAASFGMLALVPLVPFRELAFALAVGILLDVLVVRTLLVPSLLTVFGPVSGWPSRRLRRRRSVTRAGV